MSGDAVPGAAPALELQPDERIFATSHVIDGARLARGALEQMARDLRNAPVPLNVEHIPGINPIGWVEGARVASLPDGEFALIAKTRLLGGDDFLPDSVLTPREFIGVDTDRETPLRIEVVVDDRDFAAEDLAELVSAFQQLEPSVAARVNRGSRLYSADPIVLIGISITAYPFVKRLSEHAADDLHALIVLGIGKLAERARRPRKHASTFFVFHHATETGEVELVAGLSRRDRFEDVWDALDDGLAHGKAMLESTMVLRKVCLTWHPKASSWRYQYAVTEDYQVVVAGSYCQGIPSGDGVRIIEMALREEDTPESP